MRHVPGLVVLMILASATMSAADETAVIDPVSTTGVRVMTEIDTVDPAWVRCTIEWIRPSERARSACTVPQPWRSQPCRVPR